LSKGDLAILLSKGDLAAHLSKGDLVAPLSKGDVILLAPSPINLNEAETVVKLLHSCKMLHISHYNNAALQ